MTSRERNECMDQVDRLSAEIAELVDEEHWLRVSCDADDEDLDHVNEYRAHLEYERWKLLSRFPEVHYWPAELAAKGA
jgi:hypothetical protein